MEKIQKIEIIPIEKVIQMRINKQDFKLVEVLDEEQFKEGHIPQAINIPENQLEQKAETVLDKNDLIVVYCASYTCHASTNSTRKLLEMGYKSVLDFKAGKKGWKHAGFELET
ncbi:MAG: putative rhodanese-like protein [Promethearchaeota archaeon]|nr:MAG: putative rhodanese-like protein [Candidatus Lokiarchaeota archaeon]